jgi:uncharacterized protein YegJ (DUF2314 family)
MPAARVKVAEPAAPGAWETFKPFLPWLALLLVVLPVAYLAVTMAVWRLGRPATAVSTDVTQSAPGPAGRSVMITSSGNAEMDAAILRARASLDEFWSRAAAPGAGESDFMVKVALRTRKGGLEHIWVGSPIKDASGCSGRLANDPDDIAGVKVGSRVEFKDNQISDWMYRRNGKIVGNRTLRVLLPSMPEGQAAQYRGMLAD